MSFTVFAIAYAKYRDEFGIPDIPYELYLLLCSQTNILRLTFANYAFTAPDITPERFSL